MPRSARQKSVDSIYHIMVKSISEIDLFRDEDDKKKYLSIIKEYQKIHLFRVYAYCLMDNHAHIVIDANGADISRVMHDINFKYAGYYNRRHKRHGPLFYDRFKSKIVKDDRYILTLSAYVHNNVLDLPGYEHCPEKYMFSTFGVYLGLRQDPFELVEDGFVLSIFGSHPVSVRERYRGFVLNDINQNTRDEIEFKNQGTEYRSHRKLMVRNVKTEDVIEFMAMETGASKIMLHKKGSGKVVEVKAIAVLLMRSLCNTKCSEICKILGNITQGRVSELSSIGFELLKDEKYRTMVEKFMKVYA